jgi:hypothetical protein
LAEGDLFQREIVNLRERDDEAAAFAVNAEFVQPLVMGSIESIGNTQPDRARRRADAWVSAMTDDGTVP